MSEMLERANKWIADSGDDTEELQEAAAVITALKEAYLKFFNLHHTLAVNEAGIKGILCDALKIEHYKHSLHELSQMVTAKIKDLEIQVIDRGESYAMAQSQIATLETLVPVLVGSCDVCACVPATQITLCEEHEKSSRMSLDDMFLCQHDQPCDCAVCNDIAFRRSLKKKLTEKDVLAACKSAGFTDSQWCAMTLETGPYDITEATLQLLLLAEILSGQKITHELE